MKIYVSDGIYEYLAISKRDIHSGVDDDFVVKSLEQHEEEIRKPLEDEIERLKKELDLNDKEHFKNALKQLRETDYDTIRKQERLNVIAELEEWLESAEIRTTEQETWDALQELKEKLNEMKGE